MATVKKKTMQKARRKGGGRRDKSGRAEGPGYQEKFSCVPANSIASYPRLKTKNNL
jgi:hypothetical protein